MIPSFHQQTKRQPKTNEQKSKQTLKQKNKETKKQRNKETSKETNKRGQPQLTGFEMRVLVLYRQTPPFFLQVPPVAVLSRLLPVLVLLAPKPVAGHLEQGARLAPLWEARQDKTRQDKTRQDKTRQDKTDRTGPDRTVEARCTTVLSEVSGVTLPPGAQICSTPFRHPYGDQAVGRQ